MKQAVREGVASSPATVCAVTLAEDAVAGPGPAPPLQNLVQDHAVDKAADAESKQEARQGKASSLADRRSTYGLDERRAVIGGCNGRPFLIVQLAPRACRAGPPAAPEAPPLAVRSTTRIGVARISECGRARPSTAHGCRTWRGHG